MNDTLVFFTDENLKLYVTSSDMLSPTIFSILLNDSIKYGLDWLKNNQFFNIINNKIIFNLETNKELINLCLSLKNKTWNLKINNLIPNLLEELDLSKIYVVKNNIHTTQYNKDDINGLINKLHANITENELYEIICTIFSGEPYINIKNNKKVSLINILKYILFT